MKSIMSAVLTVLVAVVMSGAVFADGMTPGQIAAKCKQQAASEEVATSEIPAFIRQCLEDNGIEAADVDSTIQETAPENSDAKDSKDEG